MRLSHNRNFAESTEDYQQVLFFVFSYKKTKQKKKVFSFFFLFVFVFLKMMGYLNKWCSGF